MGICYYPNSICLNISRIGACIMKIFTFVVPTRNRVEGLYNLVDSINKTTTNKKDVEILFACDNDDKPSYNFIEVNLKKRYPDIEMRVFLRPRSPFINNDYYNWLCNHATGKYICICGDDIQVKKNNWDVDTNKKIEEYLKDKPDGIFYGNITDGTVPPAGQEKSFCCFPIIPRIAVKTVGFLLPKEIVTWGADALLYELYRNIGRIVDLRKEMIIDHVSHHNYSHIVRDTVSFDIEKNHKLLGGSVTMGLWRQGILPRSEYILKKFIKEHGGKSEGME